MFVCEKCLAAITSHEGRQHERKVYADEICDENEIVTCEWCEEDWTVDGCPNMYEI
jgi:hypothetical protein